MARRASAPFGDMEGIGQAMAAGMERSAAAAAPSLSTYVIDALLVVVPTLLVLVWGARHLDSDEVKRALGVR